MRLKRLPRLNWPAQLFRDAGVMEVAAEADRDLFAEVADLGAMREAVAFSAEQDPIVRCHYAGMVRQADLAHPMP